MAKEEAGTPALVLNHCLVNRLCRIAWNCLAFVLRRLVILMETVTLCNYY